MSFFDTILGTLPEVAPPSQKKLGFKEKLKWTLIMLVLFFVLSLVPLFGLGQNSLQQFEILSIILGASFGSLMSLGIGPIVTASIVLQLLNGSGLVKFDLNSHEGKKRFQGIQKLLAFFFILFEGSIYVFMGGLAPPVELAGTSQFLQLQLLLILQLFLGGVLVMFMDEVVSKWGFGSGISLFIVAGVSQSIFIRAFSFLPSPTDPTVMTGAIPAFFQKLGAGDLTSAALLAAGVISTVVIFFIAVYFQSMKVEIPLSFGRVRGHGISWPLSFLYTSNIPVILVSALFANLQLWANLLQNWGFPILGTFVGRTPTSGAVFWVSQVNIVEKILTQSVTFLDIAHVIVFIVALIIGCIIFGWFWVQTAGMDAKSQAKQMIASGLQIPGFRKDERVLERLLKRDRKSTRLNSSH